MMAQISLGDVATFCREHLPGMHKIGSEWRGPCPLHDGKNDSFAINAETGLWHCFSKCGRGGSFAELKRELGVAKRPGGGRRSKVVVAEYDYCDEHGTLLFQCVRYEPKSFNQRRPDGNGGWLYKLGDVRLVLFRLPSLINATTVLIAEGEKDVLALVKLGFIATCNPMGAGKWRPDYTEQLKGKHIVVFPDNDGPGHAHGEAIAKALAGNAASIRIASVPSGKDVSEWIARGATRGDIDRAIEESITCGDVPLSLAGTASVDWKAELITSGNGQPKAILANAITALKHAPDWDGVLGFNEFAQAVLTLKPPPFAGAPGAWTDNHDRLATDWLQRQGITVSVEIAASAVQTVSREHPFHPVREYLSSLQWDGTPRLDNWLAIYLGCAPNEYSKAVGSRWLISAAARIFDPGVKADCALILEGPQGLMKSSALRVLGGPWFTDDIADLGSKDAVLQTKGAWIIELAELDSLSRADVSKIKGFMSRTTDRIRPPYGRRLEESPRQCVFAGSVNHPSYLRDETGGRRFWPVECTKINIDALARDRDQLWAEAVCRYKAGCIWWLDTPELISAAAQEQSDRLESDPWQEKVVSFLVGRASVSINELLGVCMEKQPATWTQADKTRLARILMSLRWVRKKAGPREQRQWRYFPESVTQDDVVSHAVSQSQPQTGSPQVVDAKATLPPVSQCPSSGHAHALGTSV